MSKAFALFAVPLQGQALVLKITRDKGGVSGEQWRRSGESTITICGLSLLVLFSAVRGFSPGTLVFPSP